MGRTADREYALSQERKKVEAYIERGKRDFGENHVTTFSGEDGSTIIRIENSATAVSRKEHQVPEHLRTFGG